MFLAEEVGASPSGLLYKYSLKRRAYVSTTTLDPRLTFVLCNLAGIRQGCKVLDPFCGSGSTLLGASLFGAKVMIGVDVNSSISLSKVNDNFRQASLPPPTAYVFGDAGDKALQDRELAPHGPFDAIIADPPYGKREK